MSTSISRNDNGNTVDVTTSDSWVCTCGNTPESDGFYPCNNYGHEVEPTPEDWDGASYVCGRCELVFDMTTGKPYTNA